MVLKRAPQIPPDPVGYNANKIDLEALKADNKKKKKVAMKSVITPSQLWLLGENCPHIRTPINPQGNKLAGFIVLF